MPNYEPVIAPNGELAWEGDDGQLYEMDREDQNALRLAALEDQAATFHQQSYQDDDDDELTEEELDDILLQAVVEEDRKRGHRLTSKELENYVTHVRDEGDLPDDDSGVLHNLDDDEQRRQWLAERADDINNGDIQ